VVALSIFPLTRQITYADEISTDYTVEWAAKEPERRHFAIEEIARSVAHSSSLIIPELYYRISAIERDFNYIAVGRLYLQMPDLPKKRCYWRRQQAKTKMRRWPYKGLL